MKMRAVKWVYRDSTGVEREGIVERTSDHGGTDVTYFFRRADGKLDVLSGSRVKDARVCHPETLEVSW